ncbi:hypothetical protein DENSPDRAFT_136684 [Dentipellis sp. KUC8613]|nr:hypothetical protein DENSPDRAFT_136684 [Dentipellis sp. KUC8613]
MQPPTCTGLRVRTTRDADIIFHAVDQGLLPMVSRRLDSEERMALCPGCVYVWEERSSTISESIEQGIERFTEGRSWGPSRARDDFLFYHEKGDAPKSLMVERTRAIRYQQEGTISWLYPRRKGERMVKQTYSVYVGNPIGAKKWHLNAYWTQETLNHLATVDDIPMLRSIVVPSGRYICARTSRLRENAARAMRTSPPDDQPSQGQFDSDPFPEYASFQIHHDRGDVARFPPPPPSQYNGLRLAPLEELQNIRHRRRDPITEVALLSLNTTRF